MHTEKPLILTLKLDDKAQIYFNQLRKKYFPPERNFLDAHLTLFHHLPANEPGINNTIENLAAGQQRLEVIITNMVSIGNGVAFKCDSAELQKLHGNLQRQWQQWLIPQDRQKLWPHITIQNKVNANTAANTLKELSGSFTPFTAQGLGFSLWRYLDGPWQHVRDYLFQ
ncbi:2'-5' RNA ligase family protein [Mucilaginibacter roseus]|uniref:2'-5' RNA ligase family protein n=1 Tax=Mucilaginibacter roseus TaxID=1528868 RepID=A0ABS8U1M4_9SPHI|nr:2'-5' RNA ligase family protein [Mucilaginibacter roseus]MCD8739980.1 2'-5' RNA ligase family protein [Mucilaginibacter roseus]